MSGIPIDERLILVTGASGYVGGRLVRQLLTEGFTVRVFVRDKKKISGQPWYNSVEIAEGNASNFEAVKSALQNVHTAYYLLHSMSSGSNFAPLEEAMAINFAKAASESQIQQIVFLGGIANDKQISKHLSSRMQTGIALASGDVPVIELRAGIIIGSGSASFEMLRHLIHRLPIMTTPKWVRNLTQPIAIRDVLWYLTNVAKLDQPISERFDIAGPEVISYEDLMQTFARLSGLRRRIIIIVPVLTPRLSSLWIGMVTPVPTNIARPLVGSLISEVVADPKRSISRLIPPPPEGLLPIVAAMELALSRTSTNQVVTRWSDATSTAAPWQKAQSDPDWAGEILYHDYRELTTDVALGNVWSAVEQIGGEVGWYGSGWLWQIRGLMDRMIGGVGLRRGRRDPKHLRVGDSLDFWRVEVVEPNVRLRLYAEMVLPGKAWLEFRLSEVEENGQIRRKVVQEASFSPRGLGGQIYWFVILPFHIFIFPSMLRHLVKAAATKT